MSFWIHRKSVWNIKVNKTKRTTPLTLQLTKQGIGEAVPLTAVLSNEPPPVQARSETKGCPENAHKDVAQADVQQDEVDGRPEAAKLGEYEQSEKVAEDSRHEDEAETYCHHRVAGSAQPTRVLWRRGVPRGGVGAEAGAGEGAVGGAEIAAACVDDHSSEAREGSWRGAGHTQQGAQSPHLR